MSGTITVSGGRYTGTTGTSAMSDADIAAAAAAEGRVDESDLREAAFALLDRGVASSGMTSSVWMLFLRRKLGSIDNRLEEIRSSMEQQFDRLDRLESLRRGLESLQSSAGGAGTQFDNSDRVGEATFPEYMASHPELQQLFDELGVSTRPLRVEDLERVAGMVGEDIRTLKMNTEVGMVELQTLMQDRTASVQMVSNVIAKLNEAQQSVIGNLR